MISSSFFRGTQDEARRSMIRTFEKKGYCIVSFLYFAQAMKFNLYIPEQQSKTQKTYAEAIKKSDKVFLDGIAMQIFDRCGGVIYSDQRKWTQNLNGTDFLPFLLSQNKEKNIGIILSTVYDSQIEKGPERMERGLKNLKKKFPYITIIFSHQTVYQKRGKNFPFEELQDKLDKEEKYDYIFFLNGIGGPAQEIRAQQHIEFFKKNKLIVLNNGATIDYYSKFEKRAPQWVVKIRIGETLRRIITQPKKNLHKFISMFKIIRYRIYMLKKILKRKQGSGK